jgi:hypothetical protein
MCLISIDKEFLMKEDSKQKKTPKILIPSKHNFKQLINIL